MRYSKFVTSPLAQASVMSYSELPERAAITEPTDCACMCHDIKINTSLCEWYLTLGAIDIRCYLRIHEGATALHTAHDFHARTPVVSGATRVKCVQQCCCSMQRRHTVGTAAPRPHLLSYGPKTR